MGKRMRLLMLFSVSLLLVAVTDPSEDARTKIVAAYQRSLDILQRGDAAAMQPDTDDWTSITMGSEARTPRNGAAYSARYLQHEAPTWMVSHMEA